MLVMAMRLLQGVSLKILGSEAKANKTKEMNLLYIAQPWIQG